MKKELENITAGEYIPKPGVIYTMLRRMEKKGFVSSKWDSSTTKKDKRVYFITERGVEVLKIRLKAMKKRMKLLQQLMEYYDSEFYNSK